MKPYIKALFATFLLIPVFTGLAEDRKDLPNFVIFNLDDSGYSDFSPFGNTAYSTPHVQKLADEGCRLTNFHTPQAVCSASRAALLTGCYPERVGVDGPLIPGRRGLEHEWKILPERLKGTGYVSGIFGKWHLGDHDDTRPHMRGFDESSGLMYSNDMWRHHPLDPKIFRVPLKYWKNGKIIIEDFSKADQKNLTKWSAEDSVDFINRQKDKPFFLYVPFSMPHVPLYVSKEFENRSGLGLYADVMMEIDWAVGQVMTALKNHKIDDKTLIIFTSDNGPWTEYGNHAGKTPYREGKWTAYEGGTRNATIIKYPKAIKAGTTCDKFISSLDVVPTLLELAGIENKFHSMDGKDIIDYFNPNVEHKNLRVYYPFTVPKFLGGFSGVYSADGRWKLVVPFTVRSAATIGNDGVPGEEQRNMSELALYDMKNDPYEKNNVIDKYPELVAQLMKFARSHNQKFYPDRFAIDKRIMKK